MHACMQLSLCRKSSVTSVYCNFGLVSFPENWERDLQTSMAVKEGASRVDCSGLPLTCANDDALECYNKALLEYVAVRQSALPHWTKALEFDPSFVLTHCALVSSRTPQVQ